MLSAKYGTFSEPVATYDYQHSQHYGSFVVGTPSEEIKVIWCPTQIVMDGSQVTISTTKANQTPTKANESIFKFKYGSGTVSDFYSKNTMNIGGMSMTDCTFAEVSDVSGQE